MSRLVGSLSTDRTDLGSEQSKPPGAGSGSSSLQKKDPLIDKTSQNRSHMFDFNSLELLRWSSGSVGFCYRPGCWKSLKPEPGPDGPPTV